MAVAEPERSAVRGADEKSVVNQEFARCVLQAPTGMRAFVVVSGNARAGTHQDQIESTRTRIHMHGDGTSIGDGIEPA